MLLVVQLTRVLRLPLSRRLSLDVLNVEHAACLSPVVLLGTAAVRPKKANERISIFMMCVFDGCHPRKQRGCIEGSYTYLHQNAIGLTADRTTTRVHFERRSSRPCTVYVPQMSSAEVLVDTVRGQELVKIVYVSLRKRIRDIVPLD